MVLRDDELLERAAALRSEARAFLDRHAVEPRLAPAGFVEPVGSFVTGLMVWRDVDVCVDARDLERPSAWELVRPLVHAADRRDPGAAPSTLARILSLKLRDRR